MTKRLVSILTMAMLAAGILAGCGSPSPNAATGGDKPAAGDKAEAPSGGDAAPGGALANDESIKEFTLAYSIAPTDGPDIPDMWLWKEYEKMTGIKINWMYIEPAAVGEQKNLIMMSDDKPDAWYGGFWGREDLAKLGADGLLLNLEPYLDEYAPSFAAELEKIPGGRASMTLPDGGIYSTAMIMNDPPQITDRYWINKDWLDNLGLSVPKTIPELTAAFEAFKTQDANGNGDPNDEYPIFLNNGRYGQLEVQLCGTYGVGNNGIQPIAQWYYLDDAKKPQFLYTSQGIKDIWQLSADWWQKGYFHPDTFGTVEYETWVTAGKESKVGFYEWVNAGILLPDAYKHYAGINCFERGDGSKPVESWWDYPVRDNGIFTITNACKAPGTLLKWIDYFYSDEGVEFSCFGKEGETFTRNDDGKPVYIDEINNFTRGPQVGAWQYGFLVYGSFPQRAPLCIDNEIARKQDSQEWERLSDHYADCEKFAPDVMPALLPTLEETERINVLSGDLSLLINESRVKFITGEWNFESDWDNYVKSIEDMGMAEFMQIRQAQYDRFQAANQ